MWIPPKTTGKFATEWDKEERSSARRLSNYLQKGESMGKFKLLTMKYPNKCGACGKELPEGTKAWATKSAFRGSKWHFECRDCRSESRQKVQPNPKAIKKDLHF
jgi:hypothetical protein